MPIKKVLVTGSEGFTGSHLSEQLLRRGYKILPFDIKRGNDVNDPKEVNKAVSNSDVVFNLAGLLGTHELIDDVIKATEVNVLGTLNILEAAKRYGKDVVHISKPNVWLNTYTITKRASEDFVKMYIKEFGLKGWIVKWFNVFGPGQHYGSPQKLAPTSIVKALLNKSIPIFGNGKQTADHIYVVDAVNAAIDVYECEDAIGTPVEVGLGEDLTINTFVRKVIDVTKSKSKINYLPMRRGEAENSKIRADVSFLNRKVGFKPKYSINGGLRRTVPFYQRLIKRERTIFL